MSMLTENTIVIRNSKVDELKKFFENIGETSLAECYKGPEYSIFVFDYRSGEVENDGNVNFDFAEPDYLMESNYLDGEGVYLRGAIMNDYSDDEDTIASLIKEGKLFKELQADKKALKKLLSDIRYSDEC